MYVRAKIIFFAVYVWNKYMNHWMYVCMGNKVLALLKKKLQTCSVVV